MCVCVHVFFARFIEIPFWDTLVNLFCVVTRRYWFPFLVVNNILKAKMLTFFLIGF